MMRLILIIIMSLCGGIIAAPLPPLERLPNIPAGYTPPPSPFEKTQVSSNRVAMIAVRRRHKQAVIALANDIGAPTGTTYEAVLARAEALEGVKVAFDNDVPLASGVTTMTGVIGVLAGYLLSRKNKFSTPRS